MNEYEFELIDWIWMDFKLKRSLFNTLKSDENSKDLADSSLIYSWDDSKEVYRVTVAWRQENRILMTWSIFVGQSHLGLAPYQAKLNKIENWHGNSSVNSGTVAQILNKMRSCDSRLLPPSLNNTIIEIRFLDLVELWRF
jgi:hypothetical protein